MMTFVCTTLLIQTHSAKNVASYRRERERERERVRERATFWFRVSIKKFNKFIHFGEKTFDAMEKTRTQTVKTRYLTLVEFHFP